jgi:hypothetical protein
MKSNETDSVEKTRTAWNTFNRCSDIELDNLLFSVGVEPCKDRNLKIQQCVAVWFNDFIPNMDELSKLSCGTITH